MTILPKKKPTTSKTECEPSEHQGGHASHSHQHHQATTDARHEKATRSRNSPTRWVPSTAREEKLASHDPGGTFEGHESVNNKRRHRSSPHRTHARKHRMHASATVTSREYQASTEYEETGYNSGDEYVPPQHPDNIEEVWTISCLCHTSVNACRYLVYLVGHPMCQINENSPHQPKREFL